MSTAILISTNAFELANQGEHRRALQIINEYTPKSKVECRILGHSRAEVKMLQGNFTEALDILKNTRKNYGDNLCLLGDIVFCYYSLSNFKLWSLAFDELRHLFSLYAPLLDHDRRMSIQLTIAKFLEEQGKIKEALDEYTNLLSLIDEATNLKRYYRTLCQSFRVLASFGSKSSMAQTYVLLETIGSNNINLHSDIDVQQCLMLGEISLLGPDSAAKRLSEVISNKNISSADKKLLYYDFLEECLAKNLEIPLILRDYLGQFKDLNSYEKCIHELAFNNSDLRLINQLHRLGSEVSFSCYLRLLGLALARYIKTSRGIEVKRKFKIAVESLDLNSRNFWIQRYRQYLVSHKEIEINFNAETRELIYNDKKVSIARKETFSQLISFLLNKTEVQTSQVIQLISSRDYDEAQYRSLRMIIHRLNATLFDLTGTPKLIEIGKQQIRVKCVFRV